MKNSLPKIAVILGTRPEIIKLSPVVRELERVRADYFILHTNQHYSAVLDQIFFRELELPRPRYNLHIGSGKQGEQTGRMLAEIEKVLLKEKPGVVLVQGDTNTVLAGALAAAKLGIQIGHVEAGLRSYDRSMPEEINRILTDHLTDYLFAPTVGTAQILRQEGIPADQIFNVGNTIVDAIKQNLELAKRKSAILKKLDLQPQAYLVLTLHRPANVDQASSLKNIFGGLAQVHQALRLPIIFPAHPRTVQRIQDFKLTIPAGVRPIEPVGYLDFLMLEKNARLLLTDSGGVQEEACILRLPCVTLRANTERPETLASGGNVLASGDAARIFSATTKMLTQKIHWSNPFGTGTSAKKIIQAFQL